MIEIVKMDTNKIKDFWDKRAIEHGKNQSLSVTNLEPDVELQEQKVLLERTMVSSMLKVKSEDRLLDLGCGVGAWSFYFAPKVKEVVGVEYSEAMLDAARMKAQSEGITNVSFNCASADEFICDYSFSVVFISGLILYLEDDALHRMLARLQKQTTTAAKLFLREPAGVSERHIIENRWSEALEAHYSALYRTREELIQTVEQYGFELDSDCDMFPEGSPLNKWDETRLRLYLFKKKES